MLDFSFMDEVHAFTYKGWHHGNKKSVPTLRRYRQWLREAVRFTVDDAMVRLTCELTRNQDKIGLWSSLARLPFDKVWIEFDLHEKVKKFNELNVLKLPFNPEQVSRAVGYLLVKDSPHDRRWIATEFQIFEDMIWPQPVDMIFDPEGGEVEIVTGSTLLNRPTLSRIPGLDHVSIVVTDGKDTQINDKMPPEWGFIGSFVPSGGGDRWPVHKRPDGSYLSDGVVELAPWAMGKIGATINPLWDHHFEGQTDRLHQVVNTDLTERTGALRFVMCLLAMINDVPTKTVPVRVREGSRAVGMHRLKYMEHSHISIAVPKKKELVFVERLLSHTANKKRRHRVRGHWKCVERGRAIPCNHLATMVEDGVGLCLRCERMIRWVPNYERGDASLGWVQQDYEVTGKR